ncbi:MAG: dTMP kinase [Chitinophagia bacterium]|nr:dTMP kinase [Chitinophagia bacterium]
MLIVIEGIDGSGKSTQAHLLAEKLQHTGKNVYSTCQPTYGVIGKTIREALKGNITLTHPALAQLFAADRLEHILNPVDGLLKQIAEGNIVVCDRYYLSSCAYHGLHLPIATVMEMNKLCAQYLKPDLHIYINLSPDVAYRRIMARNQTLEMFEAKEMLEKISNNYMTAIEMLKNTENICIINGNQPILQVTDAIFNAVSQTLHL